MVPWGVGVRCGLQNSHTGIGFGWTNFRKTTNKKTSNFEVFSFNKVGYSIIPLINIFECQNVQELFIRFYLLRITKSIYTPVPVKFPTKTNHKYISIKENQVNIVTISCSWPRLSCNIIGVILDHSRVSKWRHLSKDWVAAYPGNLKRSLIIYRVCCFSWGIFVMYGEWDVVFCYLLAVSINKRLVV